MKIIFSMIMMMLFQLALFFPIGMQMISYSPNVPIRVWAFVSFMIIFMIVVFKIETWVKKVMEIKS